LSQRTREVGIRMALGARRSDVMKLVVGQGMALVGVGLGLGLLASIALRRVMSGLLFGVSATDPLVFSAFAVLMAIVALLANCLPARRAARVDPMVALRYE
jgi:putative ABC transport system permease protein